MFNFKLIFLMAILVAYSNQLTIVDLKDPNIHRPIHHNGQIIFKFNFSDLIDPSTKMEPFITNCFSSEDHYHINQLESTFFLFKQIQNNLVAINFQINLLSFPNIRSDDLFSLILFFVFKKTNESEIKYRSYRLLAGAHSFRYNLQINSSSHDYFQLNEKLLLSHLKAFCYPEKIEITGVSFTDDSEIYQVATDSEKCSKHLSQSIYADESITSFRHSSFTKKLHITKIDDDFYLNNLNHLTNETDCTLTFVYRSKPNNNYSSLFLFLIIIFLVVGVAFIIFGNHMFF